MAEALLEVLPIAVAIAVSPIPIAAVILMLLSDHGTPNAVAFLVGWAVALVAIAGGVALLGIERPAADGDAPAALTAGRLAVAALLVAAAAHRWRRRNRPRPDDEEPRLLRASRSLRPPATVALGFTLIALNPKDGLLSVAAGAELAADSPALADATLAVAAFALVASATIIAPIIATVLLGPRAPAILERSRLALERHGDAAVAAVLLVLGLYVAAEALAGAS
jgi:hypothetical protein